jgi:hypothetical protein
MAQTSGRTYTMGNDVMLERARVFRDRLSVELPDFTARFPWLDAAWAAAFEAEIAAADAFPSDLSVRLDMKVVTGDLLDAMQRGHAALRVLSGYAALAWPADRSRQRAFGQDKWKAAQQSTLRLAEALELAHATAQDPDFKPHLMAKGCTQADIDQLAAMASELRGRNNQQEAANADRKVKRHDRIMLFNAVWQRMTTLSTCASVVWVGDAERRKQYQRYSTSTKRMKEEDVAEGE